MSTLKELGDIVTTERIVTDGAPSASVALLENGKISSTIFTNGNGDTDTIYQSCSISKAITALAVAKLVDERRFTYDTKIADHLPQETLATVIDSKTAHFIPLITVRMLLSHTSGLSQGGFPGYVGEPASPLAILAGDHPSITPKVRFTNFPGAQFSYSGGGFTLLQLFLERVTGIAFAEMMEQTVLKPLDMNRSHYGYLPNSETNYAQPHWTGVTEIEEGHHKFPELAAAGLWTTPSDLLKAVAATQRSLTSSDGFLTQATAKAMLTRTPQSTENFGGFALGWGVEDGNPANQGMFAHSGYNYPGYTSFLLGFKDSNDGLAVMVNSFDGFNACIQRVVSALFYLKGWTRPTRLPAGYGKCNQPPYTAPHGKEVDSAWMEWAGQWEGGWSVVDKNGPKLGFEDRPMMALRPAAVGPREGEIVCAVDGLEMAVRLFKTDGEHRVELWQVDPTELKRIKNVAK